MPHREQWVANGPITGSDWRFLNDAQPELIAPGGVVLCWETTTTPHPDAERAAQSAWTILQRWKEQTRGPGV